MRTHEPAARSARQEKRPRERACAMGLQVLSSRVPPVRAAAVASDLYKPHAYLHAQGYLNLHAFGSAVMVSPAALPIMRKT